MSSATYNQSLYLEAKSRTTTKVSFFKRIAFSLSVVLAMAFLFSSLPLLTNPTSSYVYADEDKSEAIIKKAFDDDKVKRGDEGFFDALDKAYDKPKNTSFFYLISRIFVPQYMNRAENPEFPKQTEWYEKTFNKRDNFHCGKGYKTSGSYYPGEKEGNLLWHNCDVPNLSQEILQDITRLIFPGGMVNADADSSYSYTHFFGFSSESTPENTVRGKGNALETYGYSMRLTDYDGEWDYIKVSSNARLLANFGVYDRFKLGAHVVFAALSGGSAAAFDSIKSDLKSGDLFRIVAAGPRAILAAIFGGASAGLNSIIDTSDSNVFATYSWYRPDFSSTTYNLRERTMQEQSDYMLAQLAKSLDAEGKAEKAKVPEDLKALNPNANHSYFQESGLPTPGVCQSKIVITTNYTEENKKSDKNERTVSKTGGDATETKKKCEKYIKDEGESFVAAREDDDKVKSASFTTKDLKYTPKKTQGEWDSETGWPGIVDKYTISCPVRGLTLNIDGSGDAESTDPAWALNFIDCLKNPTLGYEPAVTRATLTEQTKNNRSWTKGALDLFKIGERETTSTDFVLSAQNLFICVDENGEDLRKDGGLATYGTGKDSSLKVDSACLPVRTPIQNGMFGNGYIDSDTVPEDTRRSAVSLSVFSLTWLDNVAINFGLGLSKFSTRLSNSALNLSFEPIMSSFGLDEMIAKMIESFRDSLFFPISLLMVAIGALHALASAATKGDYMQQTKSLLAMVIIFILGSALMIRPLDTVQAVEKIPAAFEGAIVAAVLAISPTEKDSICEVKAEVPADGSLGKLAEQSSQISSRVLLCENWKMFTFTPYLFSQWGVSYEKLDAETMNSQLDEKQSALVGTPEVELAGGVQKNWALYQMDLMTSGTAFTRDHNADRGTSKEMYKLVDLQAGPQVYGKQYADEYFETWSGQKTVTRIMTSLVGAGVSILGAITIIGYAFTKIVVTISSTLLLLFLPFMLLLGLYWQKGGIKLKGYLLQILSLMIQRVALTFLIALLFTFLHIVSTATTSFLLWSLLMILTCIIFLMYRKNLMEGLNANITSGTGGFSSGVDPKRLLPQGVRRSVSQYGQVAMQAPANIIGGYMAGGGEGVRQAFAESSDRVKSINRAAWARDGFTGGEIVAQARGAAKSEAESNAQNYFDDTMKARKREEFREAAELAAEKSVREDVEARVISHRQSTSEVSRRTESEMNRMYDEWREKSGSMDPHITTTRAINKLDRAEKKLDKFEEKIEEKTYKKEGRRRKKDEVRSDNSDLSLGNDIDGVSEGAEAARQERADSVTGRQHKKVDKSNKKIEKLRNKAGERVEFEQKYSTLSESAAGLRNKFVDYSRENREDG